MRALSGLEREFDGGLQNARAADTVDVADAAAEGRGDLTEVGSNGRVGRPKAGVLVMLKASKRASRLRLAINREDLGQCHVVGDVGRPAELVAARIAERARNRVGG